MKVKRIVVAAALGLLMMAGYQVQAGMDEPAPQAQMDESMPQGQMGNHSRCRKMMGEGMGGMHHMKMDDRMGGPEITPEQQAKIDEIEAKYHDELQAKEKALDDKMAAFDKAWDNDATTVAELKVIQGQLRTLKDDYRRVRIQMSQESGAAIGMACSCAGCGQKYCNGPCDKPKCDKPKCDGKGGRGPM